MPSPTSSIPRKKSIVFGSVTNDAADPTSDTSNSSGGTLVKDTSPSPTMGKSMNFGSIVQGTEGSQPDQQQYQQQQQQFQQQQQQYQPRPNGGKKFHNNNNQQSLFNIVYT
jgi:hypothetical protein